MNATTGNVSAFVWDEVNFTSTGTTVDYHFNGDIGVSTVPSFTVEKENIEIELNWIEPLDLIMDAYLLLWLLLLWHYLSASSCRRLRE